MKRFTLILVLVFCASASVFGQTSDELTHKAMEAYQQKRFKQAAELFAKAIEAGASDADVAYGAACSFALAGDRDRAFAFLGKAADLGFADPDQAGRDKDLGSLRGDPRWGAVMARMAGKAKDRAAMWDSPAIATPAGEELTEDLRLAGLSKLWAEARYNFAFPDKLVEIGWDGLYLAAMPKVRAARTVYDYYRLLQEFCAKLGDGHSGVSFPPDTYAKVIGRPGLHTRLIEDRVLIIDVWDPDLRTKGLAPGMEITGINGLPVRQYAETWVTPLQSASTAQDLETRVYENGLLTGPVSEALVLTLRSADGRTTDLSVRRKLPDERKAFMPKTEPFVFRMLPGNVAYVVLNTFNEDAAADGFIENFAAIAKSDALIIDIRDNGGGNSNVGYRVMATLVDRPFLGSRWATRDYRPAFRAWGRAEQMYSPAAETLPPDGRHYYAKPVVVLTSARTYSAAEDFLVAFDTSRRGTIVGEPSGGSTGQPLSFKLPGGGTARVCSKRDTYADGRPFVGKGVQPQVLVRPTVADVRAGRDPVLDSALTEIRNRLAGR